LDEEIVSYDLTLTGCSQEHFFSIKIFFCTIIKSSQYC